MENQKRKITKGVVAGAKPAEREYMVWDTALPGFGLRVRPSGATSYVFVYRLAGGRAGKVRKATITASTPDGARAKAKALAAAHHAGGDPAEEKAAARRKSRALTVADVLDRFVADHVERELKPSTARDYRRLVASVWKPRIGALSIEELATKDVAEAYQAMRKTPTQAALAVRVLSSAMSLAEEWGLRPAGSNPCRIRIRGARRRERLFSEAEVARLFASIDELDREGRLSASVARGLRLLFATGCRAGEITSLRWDGANLDDGVLRWDDTKTGALEKPITDEVRPLLESADRIVGVPWVCPSPTLRQMRVETLEAGFERVMAAAGIEAGENASLHLIRHWFASKTYSDPSIPLPVAMKIVGHTSVATAMRYAHVDRAEVHQAAADAASRRSAAVRKAGDRGKVVALDVGA